MKKEKMVYRGFRIPEPLLKKLQEYSQKDDRSVNQVVILLLKKALEK